MARTLALKPAATILKVDPRELRLSLAYSWMVLSVFVLLAVVLPLLLPPDVVFLLSPKCVWKTHYGIECPTCGMTTAFVQIADGRWGQAFHSNRGAVPLYLLFAANSLVWINGLWRLYTRPSTRCARNRRW